MKRLRKILRWLVAILFIILAIPLGALLFAWGSYRYVVGAKPGQLKVAAQPGTLGAEVDPFIGTGGIPWMCAHDSPCATLPFGMVRLAPDTASLFNNTQGLNRSGYYYGDNKILGFSHTRLLGADSLEGGVFRVLPTVKSLACSKPHDERFVRFSHRDEIAFPGYYAVRLPSDNILVELTATTRVGVHRYTFPADVAPHLLLDVTSTLGGKQAKDGVVNILPEKQQVSGSVRIYGSFSGRYDGLMVYFAAQFSQPFKEIGTWQDNEFHAHSVSEQADSIGAEFEFAPNSGPIEMRLALSYVNSANARTNLEAEAGNKSFEDIYTAARDAWEERLGRIQIEGGGARQRRIFYTALYRTFQMPTTFNDVNGEYMGFDGVTHTVKDGETYYTDFSLWDSFRTVHPLYNLIARHEERDMMQSLVEMAKAGGCLPRWPSGAGYTNCMFGTPADVAVSEAYLKGVRDFDIDTAYAKMRETALTGKPAGTKFAGREGLNDYLKYGYCPSDTMSDAVSATLEYSWCDTALSLLAKELGHSDDAELFAKHGQSYRNVWDPHRLFFVPRDTEGVFTNTFDPLVLSYTDSKREFTDDFVEGSAMMWRWSVPYDAAGFVSLFPSKEQFARELEDYFEKSNKRPGNWHPGSHYWHGNEPFFNAPYLFNAAGRPDLTQKWVRHILDTKYSDDYVGLDGNDDGGTLSAWYVLSALGIYPIAGTTTYELGTPLFPKATLDLGDGKTLSIVAENYAPESCRVEHVLLNGQRIDSSTLDHAAIGNGGELRFVMAR